MSEKAKKPVRVWVDGCFDLAHFGHGNLLRRAKQLGDYLVAGVHADEDIAIHKGPPVFKQEDRCRLVKAIKWVDEIVDGSTYFPTAETLDEHGCDFYVHGNDISWAADGTDTLAKIKECGRYKEVPRTEGVSTTDLVGRMLLLTKTHHSHDDEFNRELVEAARRLNKDPTAQSPLTRVSRFLASTKTIMQFAEGRSPEPGDKIVYVCGAFDLFHVGHLSFLEEARKLGDYLIVGIYSDTVVNAYKGRNYPIMTMFERVLTVLSYKPVSEVIIGAPYEVTKDLINRFNISLVVGGIRGDVNPYEGVMDPYKEPKKLGIFKTVDSGCDLTTGDIIERIISNRQKYNARNIAKGMKDIDTVEVLEKLKIESDLVSTSVLVVKEYGQ